jgi:hypothetical protein
VPAAASGAPASLQVRDNGVDPAALGKGDWIWQLPTCTNRLGGYVGSVTDLQSLLDWEKSHGMQWIAVKCGDGGSLWSQFTADLVNRAHAAGLKIFGWAYAYGNNVSGEINVARNALSQGADGFIIDAEGEYESLANNDLAAAQYCQGIRAVYPNRFLAHAPFPIVSLHAGYPYATFGTNCDAVMPQAYWADIGGTNYAVTMVTRMNTEWRNWQKSLAGSLTNAIKPLAPIAQGYNSANGAVDGAQISNFLNALRTNTPPATVGGYKGVSFWSAQHHGAAPDKWPAIGGGGLGDFGTPPYFSAQPVSRVVDAGAPVGWGVWALGTVPLSYQWRCNGTKIAGATNDTFTLAAAQLANTGLYTVLVTNAYGSVTSRVASLSVYPPQAVAFADDFDTNSAALWTFNGSSSDSRVTFHYDYAADGIPSAPHAMGGTTTGVKFEANLTGGSVAALSVSPVGQGFAGDHRLHFDLWLNANGPFPAGGVGSTEFLTAGVGTGGHRVAWAGPGAGAEGCWFAVAGEGGVADASTTLADFGAYLGTNLQNVASGVYAAGLDANARGNGHAYYQVVFAGGQAPPLAQQAAYPQQTGALNAGTLGFGWHDVLIARQGRNVEWAIDGVKLATLTNVTFTASNIFMGYWDPFASVSDNAVLSFGVVDNVRVESPAVAPSISAPAYAVNQGFRLSLSGVPGCRYAIQGSTNLVAWVSLATNTAPFGFADTNAGARSAQFYRAVLQ